MWKTGLLRLPPAAFSSETSGDLTGRHLVGRAARASAIGSGISQACRRRAIGCLESQPHRDSRLRPANQQCEMGFDAGKRSSLITGYRAAKKLRGQRLPNRND